MLQVEEIIKHVWPLLNERQDSILDVVVGCRKEAFYKLTQWPCDTRLKCHNQQLKYRVTKGWKCFDLISVVFSTSLGVKPQHWKRPHTVCAAISLIGFGANTARENTESHVLPCGARHIDLPTVTEIIRISTGEVLKETLLSHFAAMLLPQPPGTGRYCARIHCQCSFLYSCL